MIHVLIADDHPVVRSGYRRLLEDEPGIAVAGECGDGAAALLLWQQLQPQVLVADLSMPGGGPELVERAAASRPEGAVLVFSMHDHPALVRRALEAGARGYLTKTSPPDCLADAVRALAAGRTYLAPDLPPDVSRGADQDERARLATLSPRELEVFRLLVRGLSVGECAAELCLSAKTVANHQTLIKEKLGAATMAALVHIALRQGLLLPAADAPPGGLPLA